MARLHVLAVITTTLFTLLLTLFLSLYLLSPSTQIPLISSHRNASAQDAAPSSPFVVGVGKADITGPVVEINMMGYADMDQSGSGLRQRIYCRAFIVGELDQPTSRIVYLVLDTQSGDSAIRDGILRGLLDLGPEYNTYDKNNVAVTGTHSHSGPGAWFNYLLPQITSKGFNMASYEAIVQGSVLAIQRAHESLAPGRVKFGSVDLIDASVNRSPYAYLANPKDERDEYEADVDTTMTGLILERASNSKAIGMLTWFPVHGTSLYQNNTLITGDNKGVAAYLLEKSQKEDNPDFVAGFSQSNVGDTTPNVLGAYCEDTGFACRFNDSTCGGKIEGCHGRGPFYEYPDQGTRSCFEIGRRQFEAAKSLLSGAQTTELNEAAQVSSLHTFVNMSSYEFPSPLNSSRKLHTCSAALGYGFAGGTTDGPGKFDFTQGTNDSDDSPSLKNPLWVAARDFIHEPSDAQVLCQHPKPILLDVGAAKKPYAWTPNIVDIQLLRIASLIIIIAPGEATTMSGRRWRDSIASAARTVLDIPNPLVVLGGPANTYAHYIATEEEYRIQRYEGASTLFGPHTLEAYINLTLTSLPYLTAPEQHPTLPPLAPGPSPPINTNRSYSFINPVIVDNPGFFRHFGQVLSEPSPTNLYKPGDIPSAVFVGANPRNNFRLEGTFASIEKNELHSGKWVTVRTDQEWSLVYKWRRKNTFTGTSEVTIEWEIEDDVEEGMYRIHYYGDAKGIGGGIDAFEGVGGMFRVGRQ